jgi:hypothetical protein
MRFSFIFLIQHKGGLFQKEICTAYDAKPEFSAVALRALCDGRLRTTSSLRKRRVKE